MKKLFIFIMIIIFTPLVFAQDFNVSTSDITSPNSSGTGKYTGTEIANTGTANVYNIGTRYNGKLSRIVFNLASGGYADPDGFEKGHTYTLTMNMATEDWRNKFGSVSVKCEGSSGQELSNKKVTYISMKKIKFSFTTPSNSYCQFVYVDLRSSNTSSVAFTGVSNWNLSSLVISDPTYDDSTPTPTTTPKPDSSNQDIINANNQNTQTIINNNNQNTQDVIQNQTDNTQDIIENNNSNTDKVIDAINNNSTCYYSSYNKNLLPDPSYWESGDIEVNGLTPVDSYSYIRLTTYIKVKPNTSYFLSYDTNWAWALIEYSTANQVVKYNSLKTSPGGFVTSPNTNYIKITTRYNPSSSAITPQDINTYRWQLNEGISFSGYVQSKGSVVCSSKDDETTEAINKVNDSINNSNIDNKGSFFSDFEDNTHGLTGIITLPLSTIQSLTNNTCVPLNIPIPFTNSNVTLPCMTQVYETYIPSVYSVWQIVSFGIISYFICLDIFKMVKGFKDPNEDKIEVLDL